MSTETKQEQKYFEKLGISVLTISAIKETVKQNIRNTFLCWKNGLMIEKQTFHIIGPAGVGKTQVCIQIAEELSQELGIHFDNILVKCPVLSRDDFIIPFPVIDNGNTKFKMLYSDFVPEDKDSYGLFIIDEFSRGDHTLQQLMWQIQNEYKVHLKDLPQGWFVICLDNPDDSEYSLDILEDAAGLRRTLHIYSDVSAPDFLAHATRKQFHPGVIGFITAYPMYLYDWEAQKQGSVYANPASWERVSNILWGFEYSGGILENINVIEPQAAGLLNIHKTRLFIDYLRANMKAITPDEIIFEYDKVRDDIKKMVRENNNTQISQIISSFSEFLRGNKPTLDNKMSQNVANFLTDVPVDMAASFLMSIDNLQRTSPEFLYFTKMHKSLIGISTEYKKIFYERLVQKSKEPVNVS